MPPSLLKVVMKPIAAVGESYQYPPVNWAALLSPLMRLNFGKYQMFLGLQTLLLGCDLNRKRDSGGDWRDLWDLEVCLLGWKSWVTSTESLSRSVRLSRRRSEDTGQVLIKAVLG